MIIYYLLATYGLTVILTDADGPYGIFVRARNNRTLGALKCFVCTSVWVGSLLAVYPANNIFEWFIFALSLSGGAIFINRITEIGL